MANTLSLMTNVLRNAVSKQRIRYTENGFNLDLAYICKNIIAMGYPADNYEGIYRNRIDDVYQFFEEHHKDHYKIYNLCSERGYDVNKFHGRVAVYPFDDHNPPTIELIQKFCDDVDRWLKADKKNVAAVHCKAGKGRTGTMICCYLLHSGFTTTAEEALAFYDEKRTKDKKGVTIPSQRRYVEYYSRLIRSEKPYEKQAIEICEIKFSSPLQSQGSVHYNISSLPGPSAAEKVRVISSGTIDFRKSQSIEFKDESIKLTGDVKIEVYHKIMRKKEKYFHFWFNTYFICDENEPRLEHADGKFIREFTKYELDDAHKDKEHKNFPEDFKVQIILKPVSSQPTSYSNCNDVSHNNHFVLLNQTEVKYTTEQQQQQQQQQQLFLQKQQQLQHIQYNNSSQQQQQQSLQNNLYKNNLITSMQTSPNAVTLLAPGIGTASTMSTNLGPIFEPTSGNGGRSSYPNENHDKYIQSQLQQQQHFQQNIDSKRRSMPLQYHHTNDKMQYLHQSHHHQQQQQQQQQPQQNHNSSHNSSEKELIEFYSAAVAASSGNTLMAAGMAAKSQDQRNLVATNLGAPVKPNQSGSNQMHPEHHHYLQHHNNPPTKNVHNNQHHTPSVSPDVSRTNSSSSNHSKLSKSSNCSGNTSQNCNSNSSSSSSSSSSISSEASSAAAEEDWESGELKVKGTSSTSTYMMMMMDGKNLHPTVSSSSSINTNNLINLKDNFNFQNDNKNIINNNNNTNIKINNKNNSNNNKTISKCSSDIILNKSLVLGNLSYNNNNKNNNNSNFNNNNNKSSNNDGSNIFKFIKMKKNSSNDNNCSDKNDSNNSYIDCSSSCSKNDDGSGSKSIINKQKSAPSSAYSKLISFVAKPATQNFKAKAINAKISCNNKINNTKKKIRWFTKSVKTDPILCETLVKPISYRDVGSSISSNTNFSILNNGSSKASSLSQSNLIPQKENIGNDCSDLIQDRKTFVLQHKNSLLQKQRSHSSGTDHDDYYSSLCDRQLSFGTSPCKSPRAAIVTSGTPSSTISQDLHSIRENLLSLDKSHPENEKNNDKGGLSRQIRFPEYNSDNLTKKNIVVVKPINSCTRIGFNISDVNNEDDHYKKPISSDLFGGLHCVPSNDPHRADVVIRPLVNDNLLVRISRKCEDTLSDESILYSTEEITKINNIASEKQKLISDNMPEEENSIKNKSIINKIFNQNEEQHKICDKLRLLTMSTSSSLSSSSTSGNSSSSPSLSTSSSFSILSFPSTPPQTTPTTKEIGIASNQFITNTSIVIEEDEKQEDSVATFQSGNRCIPFSLRGIRQELLQTVMKSSSNLNNKMKANRSNSCTFPSSSSSSSSSSSNNNNNTSNSTNRFSLSSYYKKKNSLPATLLPICSSSSSFTACTAATTIASSPSPLERVKLPETTVTKEAPIPTEIEIVNSTMTSLPSSFPLSTSLEGKNSPISFLAANEEENETEKN